MPDPNRPLRPIPFAVAALLAAVLGSAAPAPGQTIDVRLQVTEQSDDLFLGMFFSALDALEEVEPSGEPADYRIDATVLCQPEAELCAEASSYALSIVLSEPLTAGLLRKGLERTGDRVLAGWEASPEAESYLRRYRRVHAVWAVTWGREEARAAADRLVERIDARCFERRRLLERRARVEGREVADMILDPSAEGGWLC